MNIQLRVVDKRLGYSVQQSKWPDGSSTWTVLHSDRLYATSLCGNAVTSVAHMGWYRRAGQTRSLAIVDEQDRILIGLPQLTEPDIGVIIDFLTKCVRTSPILIQMRASDLRAVLQQIVNRSKHLEVVGNKLRHKKCPK